MKTPSTPPVAIALFIVCLLIPIGVAFFNPVIASFLLIAGAGVTYRVHALNRATRIEEDTQHQQYRGDAARTIFVQLVDDMGNPLDPDVARARMAEAERTAGPRDTVIAVRRRVNV